jgi:Tol biopolymer transport system component/DNA-binding winged helix-turn-helix (wHTH) protein
MVQSAPRNLRPDIQVMPSRANSVPVARFGIFELDLRSGELRKSGVRIALQDQPLEILKALLEKPGDLVTRDELRQRLWPSDTFVDFEDGLNAAIRRLRDALGDDAARPRFIETLPRRGYRLIGPIQADADPPVPSAAPPLRPPPGIGLSSIRAAFSHPAWGWAIAAVLAVIVAVLGVQRRSAMGSRERVPTTRFTLATEQLAVSGRAPSPAVALSRDGRHLAYVTGRYFRGPLYLRTLNSLDATLVPGADPAIGPFFSPDGNWVAYFSLGILKKNHIGGGSPETVCKVPAQPARGASWGDDGTIVFSADDKLWRVSAQGGTPEPVANSEGALWPQVLPGSRAVIFTVPETAPNPGVWVMALDGGGRRQLVNQGGNARYVGSGYLVYALGGSLVTAPFDLETLRVRTPAVPVVSDLRIGRSEQPLLAHFAVSDAGTLAYLAGVVPSNPRRLVWVDRTGREEAVPAEPREYEWPRVSPDGARVAVSISEHDSQHDVWVYHFSQKRLMKVTSDPGPDALRPLWTPDGTRLIFRSWRPPSAFYIYSAASDGTGVPERLTDIGNRDRTVHSITPDGKTLLLSELIDRDRLDLRTLSLEKPRDMKLLLRTGSSLGSPTVSPNGRWLAYRSNETGRYEIHVRPFPDVEGGRWPISTSGGVAPVWSPDSPELFFWNDQSMMVVNVQTSHGFVAGTPRVLFSGNYEPGLEGTRNFDIDHDGKRFIMIKTVDTLHAAAKGELTVVVNWLDELRQRVQ